MGFQELTERVENLERDHAGADWRRRRVEQLEQRVEELTKRLAALEAGTTTRYAGKKQPERPVQVQT